MQTVRPSKQNQTARISLHQKIELSKSERTKKQPAAPYLWRYKLPEPRIFVSVVGSVGWTSPPPVEGYLRVSTGPRKGKDPVRDRFFSPPVGTNRPSVYAPGPGGRNTKPAERASCRVSHQWTTALGWAAAASTANAPSTTLTGTTEPSSTSPESSFCASGSCSSFWITRFSGRAP
jgi:hypothetical protein